LQRVECGRRPAFGHPVRHLPLRGPASTTRHHGGAPSGCGSCAATRPRPTVSCPGPGRDAAVTSTRSRTPRRWCAGLRCPRASVTA
jgi:hypothetical protein